MIKGIAILLIITLLAATLVAGCSNRSEHPVQSPVPSDVQSIQNVTDSLGRTVTVPVPAKKIVALYSGTAEILVALGAGDAIVGTADPTYDARPWLLGYMHNPVRVGALFTPNVEQIIALHPDLVIALPSSRQYVEKIESAGIPILYLQTDNLNDLVPAVRMMGNVTGCTENASRLIEFYMENQNLVDERLENIPDEKHPRVYMEMYSDFSAVPPNSSSGLLIARSGGLNILRTSSDAYVTVSPEWLVNENPEIIIRAVNSAHDPGIDLIPYYHRFYNTSGFDNISAVRNGRVYIFTGEMLYGPRSFAGILAMAKIMHPELFRDIDPMQALDEYAIRFIPESKNTGARMYPML